MRMRFTTAVIGALTFVTGVVAADDATTAKAKTTTWSFDEDKPDKLPAGFSFGRTGDR